MMKPTQKDIDALADILWWIKGYSAGSDSCPFATAHKESLELACSILAKVKDNEYISKEF